MTAGLAADQLPSGVRLLYRGRRTLRGIERPEEVWELVRPGDRRLAAPRSAGAGLPVPLTSFVGPVAEVERLVELIERERLVTLTGPGGSSKTRMATEAAGALAGRGKAVWLAELAPVRDGDQVAQAVATALDVARARLDASEIAAAATAARQQRPQQLVDALIIQPAGG